MATTKDRKVDASADRAGEAQRPVAKGEGKAVEKKGKVWLTWDENRIWVIHPFRGSNMLSTLTKADATLTREQVKELLKQQKQMNVLPGLHEYPEALWDKVKDHEDVEMALNDGRLHLMTEADFGGKGADSDQPARKLPETLDAVATGNARIMAEACQDLDVLRRWLAAEQAGKARGTVLTELEAQIAIVLETENNIQEAGQGASY
jgi:hypothetical protein